MSIKTVAVATTSLAVIAFAGATTYSSKVANQALDEMIVETAGGQGLIKLEQLERNSGLVKSSGVFALGLDASCIDSDIELPAVPAQIRYSVAHMPDATRLTSYEAVLELTGEAREAFESAAKQSAVLVLQGRMGFDGQWVHRTSTPEIEVDQEGVEIRIAASEGEFTGTRTNGAFAWALPSIRMTQDQNTVELSGLSAAGVIDDLQLGLGKQTIGIDRIDLTGDIPGGTALMSGVRFDYETVADDGRISSSFSPSIELVRAVDSTFQDLMFKMQVSGVDEQSLRQISQVTRHQCQTQLDDDQLGQIERAILRIIDRGVSFSISDLKGRQLENSFDGELILTLKDRGDGSDGPVISMRDRMTVAGALNVSQNLVPEHLREMLLEQRYAQGNGNMIESTLMLSDGQLLINGAQDMHGLADTVDVFLVMAEDSMSNWHEQIDAGNGPLVTMARAARQQ